MFLRLFLLFVLVPLADLVLLLVLAKVNWLITVATVIFSALFGAWFAKRSGVGVMRQIREKLRANELPTASLVDGAMVLFAGGLLLTPGLITDFFGMTILIPWTRQYYKRWLLAWLKHRFQITVVNPLGGGHRPADHGVVDSPHVRPHEEKGA